MVKERNFPEGWSKVDGWLSRLAPSTVNKTLPTFKSWLKWGSLNGGPFAGMSPDELVEYQLQSDNGTKYDILDTLVRPYVSQKRGRIGYKRKIYGTLRSFFLHSRAELPRDATFIIRPEKEKVVGTLKVEEVRNLVLSCKPVYAAIYLSMFQGAMGLSEFEYWNLNGWEELRKQLESKVIPVRVVLPGRKMSRNIRPYHTYLGTDAVNAIRNYVENFRPEKPTYTFPEGHEREGDTVTPIFVNKFVKPVGKHALYLYWIRHLRKIGILGPRPKGGPAEGHRTGKNPHELRDLFRSQWSKSGRSPVCAEFFMGHMGDPLGYDKAWNDKDWTRREYIQASKFLNIMSSDIPFGKVGQDIVEGQEARIAELEAEVTRLRTGKDSEVAALRDEVKDLRDMFKAVIQEPELIEKIKKRLG